MRTLSFAALLLTSGIAGGCSRTASRCASLGFAIVQLDVTVVNVAIPSLGHSGSSVHGLQWIVDAYTLSFAALLLTSGTLADRFGSRRLFAYGLALFLLASLGCALAPSLAALIAARVAQGVAPR